MTDSIPAPRGGPPGGGPPPRETSESEYRTLLHSSPLPMLVRRPHDPHLADVNQAFADLLGYTREELLGMRTEDVVHAESLEARDAARDAVAAGEKSAVTAVRRIMRKDGTDLWVKAHGSAIRRGDEVMIMVVFENWTDARWQAPDLATPHEE